MTMPPTNREGILLDLRIAADKRLFPLQLASPRRSAVRASVVPLKALLCNRFAKNSRVVHKWTSPRTAALGAKKRHPIEKNDRELETISGILRIGAAETCEVSRMRASFANARRRVMEFDNLRCLSVRAMVAATKPWVDPGEAHFALRSIRETAGCLDRMISAHNGLLSLQATSSSGPDVTAMTEQALTLDRRYDRLAKAVDLIAAGNALLLGPESAVASSLTALRGRIFPRGMRITQFTYLEEAGEADLVKERLFPQDRELLSTIPTATGDLSTALDEWIETGSELGDVVRNRSRAIEAAAQTPTVSRAETFKAKNQWIRVVRVLLTALDLAEEVDDPTRDLILNPLRLAVEKAKQKKRPKDRDTGDAATEPSTTVAK